ncbi:MAG: AEC family transporter [Gammaproteobacteria bacterium]|nr:AEC family transporter [Gammaproteobacteria bacterium]
MISTLLQMFALIGVGLLWSWRQPGKLETEASRKVLVGAVYYLFLPALVLLVLWRAPIGLDSVKIAAAAISGILVAIAASVLMCRWLQVPRATAGAVIIAASWPNITFLGLPVLAQTLGPWTANVAIQYDLFACTPTILTLGIVIANSYGADGKSEKPLSRVARVPAIWAALIALAFNLTDVPLPQWIEGLLHLMSAAIVPLMLISVGMALRQGFGQRQHLRLVIPVALIQLLLMPFVVWRVAAALGISGDTLVAVVLEGAMPSMVMGIVIADRHGLNVGAYAAALTATTLLCFITLPLWFHWARLPIF